MKLVSVRGSKPSFCLSCAEYYSSITKHVKVCESNCKKCLEFCKTKNTKMNPESVTCIKCRIDFHSQECFSLHLKCACMRMYICKFCRDFVNKLLYKSEHDCKSCFCCTCKEKISKLDYAHQCKIKKKENR